MSILQRFLGKVDKACEPGGCWKWIGATNGKYGIMRRGSKIEYSHRISYTLFKGLIPQGLVIDHLCCNVLCCNPNHLEAVTPKENSLRIRNANYNAHKENRCVKGHELTPENTYIINEHRKGKIRETKRCRQCRLESKLRYRAKIKSRQ